MRSVIIIYIFLSSPGCRNAANSISVPHSYSRKTDSISSFHTFKLQNCDSLGEDLTRTNRAHFGKVSRIPGNFEESLLQLDTLINPHIREWIKCLPDGNFTRNVHHTFGMYLRNKWGLWNNSKLAKYLYKMGIFHPDDMIAIILTSYQRKLKNEPLRIEEQLKYHQDFWRENGMPVDSIRKINKEENDG